jgi:hypothetical protein
MQKLLFKVISFYTLGKIQGFEDLVLILIVIKSIDNTKNKKTIPLGGVQHFWTKIGDVFFASATSLECL